MDATTRQIIALHVGDRSHESAQALWAAIPAVYQAQAMFHTDPYDVYKGVIPAERHKAIPKKARPTISSASTTHCGNASHASSAMHCPSPRRSRITSGLSNSSSATTTWKKREHDLYSTTV
jgi:hypothetical protein